MAQTVTEVLKKNGLVFRPAGTDQLLLQTCPFCGATDKFYIGRDNGLYSCKSGSCGKTGNLWTLRRQVEQISPVTTVRELLEKQAPQETANDQDLSPASIKQFQANLFSDTNAVNWLMAERGLTKDIIRWFGLGVKYDNMGGGYMRSVLVIPYFTADGQVVNIKYRNIPSQGEVLEKQARGYKQTAQTHPPLFNQHNLRLDEPVYVTEGEIDCITLVQYGYTNCVSIPQGAETFTTAHFDALVGAGKIYLCFDHDTAGEKGAKEVADRLGAERCYYVKLPPATKDANKFFSLRNADGSFTYSRADFEALVAESKTIGESSVLDIDTVIENLIKWKTKEDDERDSQVSFRDIWPHLHFKVGNLEPGFMVILQARPKIGKTTFCLQLTDSLTREIPAAESSTGRDRPAIPVLMYCLEVRPERLAERLIRMYLSRWIDERGVTNDKNYQLQREEIRQATLIDLGGGRKERQVETKVADNLYQITLGNIQAMKQHLIGRPMYFAKAGTANITPQIVFDTIRYAVRRFGIKLVIFDHLHFLCRSLKNTTADTGRVTRDFKLLFEELNIPGIVITHPKKGDENEVPGLYSTRDSGEVPGDADIVLSMHRDLEVNEKTGKSAEGTYSDNDITLYKNETVIRVTASRHSGGGQAVIFWDPVSCSFVNIPRDDSKGGEVLIRQDQPAVPTTAATQVSAIPPTVPQEMK